MLNVQFNSDASIVLLLHHFVMQSNSTEAIWSILKSSSIKGWVILLLTVIEGVNTVGQIPSLFCNVDPEACHSHAIRTSIWSLHKCSKAKDLMHSKLLVKHPLATGRPQWRPIWPFGLLWECATYCTWGKKAELT